MIEKLFSGLFYITFLVVFAWVAGQLFFKDKTDDLFVSVQEVVLEAVFPSNEVVEDKISDLRIIYPNETLSLEPTIIDPTTRLRTVNIYESLVESDRDLNIQPSLALSWGLINERTWDIRLRTGVTFHDGSSFEAKDVVASLERAENYPESQMADLFDSIREVEVVSANNIRINTYDPDPLLLQKLSLLLIIPSEYETEELEESIGSASYKFESWPEDENLRLVRYENYWDKEPVFDSVEIISETDKSERLNMFLKGEADFLAFVPQDAVAFMEQSDFKIAAIPSLEVQFLLFNMRSDLLSDLEKRLAVLATIDQNDLADSLGNLVRPVNQFVSNGVLGFNPDILLMDYDFKEAEASVSESGLEGETLILHLPVGLEFLGEHVKTRMSSVGVLVSVSYLDIDKLNDSFENGDADIYFLAFKSGLGDSSEFLQAVVHTHGDSNIGNYSNELVDQLIDDSFIEMDVESRLTALQEAMKIVVVDDVVGVPLFEFETVYSFVSGIEMQPRIDGLIYFDELNVI